MLPLAGDEAITQVALPFPVPFYGQSYTSAWVDVNGKLSFTDPGPSCGGELADPGCGGAERGDLPVLGRPGGTGRLHACGPEWSAPRRTGGSWWSGATVGMYGSSSARITFEAIIAESGQITFNYADLSTTKPTELGGGATVGIENATGTVAAQYGINQPLLANGTAVIFTPPGGSPRRNRRPPAR